VGRQPDNLSVIANTLTETIRQDSDDDVGKLGELATSDRPQLP
jgi:hypothetical protein